jgi:arylsulfatase
MSAGQLSDEIVHITDMFTTIIRWAGLEVPKDRVIDGKDQRDFLEGKQKKSSREGFPYWMGSTMYPSFIIAKPDFRIKYSHYNQ